MTDREILEKLTETKQNLEEIKKSVEDVMNNRMVCGGFEDMMEGIIKDMDAASKDVDHAEAVWTILAESMGTI